MAGKENLMFNALDRLIIENFNGGTPVKLTVDTKPESKVLNTSPLVVQDYGRVLNRAPAVQGSVPIERLLYGAYEGEEDIRRVYAIGQAGEERYVFQLDLDVVNGIASALGRSDIRFVETSE